MIRVGVKQWSALVFHRNGGGVPTKTLEHLGHWGFKKLWGVSQNENVYIFFLQWVASFKGVANPQSIIVR